jgi:single-stranded DNA-specific DHH superfamily exonuclease
MQSLEETKNKLMNFLELQKKNKIAVVADNDEDGITAMVNFVDFLEKNGQEVLYFFYDHSERTTRTFEKKFLEFRPNKTIFLDINVNFVEQILEDIQQINNYFIIDHHPDDGEFLEEKIIKPEDFSDIGPSKYPASKMVYDLVGGKDWLALIGLIGDFSRDAWEEFFDEMKKKYELSERDISEIADVCSCVISMYAHAIPDLIDFLFSAEKPKEIAESDFCLLKKEFMKIMEDEEKRFEKEAERYEKIDLIIFQTQPKLPSKLSNILSVKNPGKTVFIYSILRGIVKGSVRRQDFKVDCNKLTKYAINNHPDGNGGGHVPASGCKMPEEYLPEFKKRLVEYLEKTYHN